MVNPTPDDEVLPAGPGLPRWLPWLAGTIVVVLLVAGLAIKLSNNLSHDDGATSDAISASVHPSTAQRQPVAAPATPLAVATGPALTLPRGAEPLDIAVVGDEAWLLQGNTLSTFTTDADYRSRSIAWVYPGAGNRQPRLVVDTAAHLVWTVVLGAEDSTIHAYDSETLATRASRQAPGAISSAAPLDGTLVYSTADGVFRFAPGRPTSSVAGADGNAELTADPIRSRVLALHAATHAITDIIPASGPSRRVTLPWSIASGTFGVTGNGALWLGGYGEQGAVLVRLDPATLRPVADSPIAFEAGSGVQIVASGTDDLLVETGEVPLELACMSGTDGRAVQTWPILTRVATVTRRAGYAVVGSSVVPLELHGGCTG